MRTVPLRWLVAVGCGAPGGHHGILEQCPPVKTTRRPPVGTTLSTPTVAKLRFFDTERCKYCWTNEKSPDLTSWGWLQEENWALAKDIEERWSRPGAGCGDQPPEQHKIPSRIERIYEALGARSGLVAGSHHS